MPRSKWSAKHGTDPSDANRDAPDPWQWSSGEPGNGQGSTRSEPDTSRKCPDCHNPGRSFPSFLMMPDDYPADRAIPCIACFAKWEANHNTHPDAH